MKIYFPKYYERFRCIADKCRHSCCVGWEIDVDGETLEKYEALSHSKDALNILSFIEESDGVASIRLGEGDRCPFLESCGLCSIIKELGEEYTSEICRAHPRFYRRVGDRVEGGVGAACEEACRIILGATDFCELCLVETETCETYKYPRKQEFSDETDFDTIDYRDKIFGAICKQNLTYREKIDGICKEFSVSTREKSDEEWNCVFAGLDFLDRSHGEAFSLGGVEERTEVHPYLERFFAYLVWRHVSVATDYENLRARLGVCLLLLRILESCTAAMEKITEDAVVLAARMISEEIEYSEDNTAALIFEFECLL